MDQFIYLFGKALWFILAPSHFLLLILLFSLVILKPKPQLSHKLSVSVTLLLLIFTFSPVEHLILGTLEQHISPPTSLRGVDSIIVLGGGQQRKQSHLFPYSGFGQHNGRIIAAVDLAKKLKVPLIFVGGQLRQNNKSYRESHTLEMLLSLADSPPAMVFINDDSKDTYDNARQAKTLLLKQQLSHSLLITSAAHMPRAVGVFKQQAITITPFPVEYKVGKSPQWFTQPSLVKKLYLIEYGMHEWLGLFKYYLLGMTQAFLPDK